MKNDLLFWKMLAWVNTLLLYVFLAIIISMHKGWL